MHPAKRSRKDTAATFKNSQPSSTKAVAVAQSTDGRRLRLGMNKLPLSAPLPPEPSPPRSPSPAVEMSGFDDLPDLVLDEDASDGEPEEYDMCEIREDESVQIEDKDVRRQRRAASVRWLD